jgi:hypothetical protein
MEYIVQAKENSTTGGVGKDAGTYNRGNFVIITCNPEDEWNLGGSLLKCNANGVAGHRNPIWSINGGTMVGSIDGGKSFFPVGTLCQLMITADNTNLTLYCLDTDKDNNSGGISAQIQTAKDLF